MNQNYELGINISKSQVISFFKNSITFKFNYQLNGFTLPRVSKVRDLGIILDENWSFRHHLDHVISTSSRMIGLIKRSTYDVRSPRSLSILFKTLVLPHLLFGSIIWRPHTQQNRNRLESLVHKFLRFSSFKIGEPMDFDNHNYNSISNKLNTYTIDCYHDINDILFVYSCLSDNKLNDLPKFQIRKIEYNLRFPRNITEGQANSTRSNFIFFSTYYRLQDLEF